MKAALEDLLATGQPILADGAMGTTLLSLGLERGVAPEVWNIQHPERVQQVHREYIAAGAQVILTNSFGGNRRRFPSRRPEDSVVELNQSAARIARTEADAAEAQVVVAGSMGPTGSLMVPLGDLTYEEAKSVFAEQARGLIDGGVDVLWIETMADLDEVRAALEGCRHIAPDFPVVVTMTFDTRGHTMMGVSPQAVAQALAGLDLVAIGGNCGNGPGEIESVIDKLHDTAPDMVLVSKSNAGTPRMEGGREVYDATPEIMAEHAIRVWRAGARIIGACCGSTPDHIRVMGQALKRSTTA